MSATSENLQALKAPIPAELVSWRVGTTNEDKTQGKALPYIDARVVQTRLDEAVGPGNWKNRFVEVFAGTRLMAVRCALAIRINGEWVEKEDAAYLPATHKDDHSLEMAVKGVYSDAEKRAAVQWGIARHLYDFQAPWVDLVEGKLARIPSLDEKPTQADAGQAVSTAEQKPAATAQAEAKATAKPAAESMKQAAATPAASPAPAPASAAAPAEPEAAQLVDESKYLPAEEASAPAAAPASAPVAAPVAAAAEGEVKRSALYHDVLTKLEKKALPPAMLTSYVTGPKGKEKLTEEERTLLLAAIKKAQDAQAAAA